MIISKLKSNLVSIVTSCVFLIFAPVQAHTQEKQSLSSVLFSSVDIFDGKSQTLKKGMSVLVVGNKIGKISKDAITPPAGATVIDGEGRVLMPGLIDAHWHTLMARASTDDLTNSDDSYLHTLAAVEARSTLMRGFTTVRDLASPSFGLKRAIDDGAMSGPRIYPSGAAISQTSGHGDFRNRANGAERVGGTPGRWEKLGIMLVADGEADVMRAVREQLRLGASQIKVMAGGGVGSLHDPLDSIQYTPAEIRAAVQVASDWGTYVTAHIYTPLAIQRAVKAGVKAIEHGHLIDEPTMKLLAKQGVWLSMQPFVSDESAEQAQRTNHIQDDRKLSPASLEQAKNRVKVRAGTDRTYQLAKKYGVKLAFGTDRIFSAGRAAGQKDDLLKLLRWFTPVEILTMATGKNGDFMKLTGPRNPYPGTLGLIQTGAYADILLVNGNPLTNLHLLADPQKNISVIMKDGKIFKNILD